MAVQTIVVPEPAGLTGAEARRRLLEFGPNAVPEDVPSRWRHFAATFWGPIPWLLEGAMALQVGLHMYAEAALIAGLLLVNAIISAVQEGHASAALAALKQRLAPTALVRRDGVWVRIPATHIVPGDAVRLPLGALVPADARLTAGAVLVDQSTLTGESVPVDAGTGDNVYAGSLVRRGEATGEVVATGTKTYFGRAAELVRIAQPGSSEQRAIMGTTRSLTMINGAVVVMILIIGALFALPLDSFVRLGLAALLATIPVALPATFTLSAARGSQILARHGVLLTRLSAAHESATMDTLCADKTGTLTQNALQVAEVAPVGGFDRARVLALAALASSQADRDPIDSAIRAAAESTGSASTEQLRTFVPFDPARKVAEAVAVDGNGREMQIIKGAFEVVAQAATTSAQDQRAADDLAAKGNRVIAIAAGSPGALRLAGLIALSDPPREDAAGLITALRELGVRTIMVTGDSPVTAAAIARKVGIGAGDVRARTVPEEKFRLVKSLQKDGHVVGMCGDGVNDAPALRQAQMGIAVSTATDAAKAAAGMVLTQPGLAGIVFAVHEGRVAFRRLLTYAFNMLVKKTEVVLLLAVGLLMTGHAVLTPALMVLCFFTNDFLSMSLVTDRASFASSPSVWRMRNITLVAVLLGISKLVLSSSVLALGKFWLALSPVQIQTLVFATLVLGNQGLLYVLRERGRMWHSQASPWVVASSVVNVALVLGLASSGILMAPLSWSLLALLVLAAAVFALILDQVKLLLTGFINVE